MSTTTKHRICTTCGRTYTANYIVGWDCPQCQTEAANILIDKCLHFPGDWLGEARKELNQCERDKKRGHQ